MAIEMKAPFTKTSIERLQGPDFGRDRAARSSDIVVFNATDETFQLKKNECPYGGFSTGLLPEYEIQSHSSSVYGTESNGKAQGVLSIVDYNGLEYEKYDGKYFNAHVENPLIGRNNEAHWNSPEFDVIATVGVGLNNQVRYIIRNHYN